jgi:hypothetical protein
VVHLPLVGWRRKCRPPWEHWSRTQIAFRFSFVAKARPMRTMARPIWVIRYSLCFPLFLRLLDPLHLAFNLQANVECGQRYRLRRSTNFC